MKFPFGASYLDVRSGSLPRITSSRSVVQTDRGTNASQSCGCDPQCSERSAFGASANVQILIRFDGMVSLVILSFKRDRRFCLQLSAVLLLPHCSTVKATLGPSASFLLGYLRVLPSLAGTSTNSA